MDEVSPHDTICYNTRQVVVMVRWLTFLRNTQKKEALSTQIQGSASYSEENPYFVQVCVSFEFSSNKGMIHTRIFILF